MGLRSGVFFSLKWQAFIITSAVLIFFGSSFIAISQHNIIAQQKMQRDAHKRDLIRETEESIQQQKIVHENFGKTIFIYKNIIPALEQRNATKLQDAFNPYWFQLQLDIGMSAAIFFDTKSNPIAQWGNAEIRSETLNASIQTGNFMHYIACPEQCALHTVVPIFTDGKAIGIVLFATNLAPMLLNYKELMTSDIGIIYHNQNKHDWSNEIAAFTGWETFRKDISLIASKNVIDNISSKTITFKNNNHNYELIVTLYIDRRSPEKIYFIYISEITHFIRQQREALASSIGLSILAIIFSEVFLMLILWGPLNRLRSITHRLPSLSREYAAFLAEFPHEIKYRFFTDETDVVLFSAQKLARQLRKYDQDVTQHTNALEAQKSALSEEKQFIEILINTAQALIITLDKDGNIHLINRYGNWLTGYRQKELQGKPISVLFDEQEYTEIKNHLFDVIEGRVSHYNHHSQLKNKHGEIFYLAWYHSSLPSRNNNSHKIVSIALDISDRKRIEEHLGWLASHDPLTGLYNRRRFTEEVEQVIATSHRYQHISALLFFDLDNFKDINDIHGHHAGDEILKKVSRALRKSARESDIIARLGGDEFAVILKESNAGDAMVSADRFCQAVNAVTENINGRLLHVSASIGVALYPDHGNNLKTLLANADLAMYQAKEAGRNRCSLYEESSGGHKETETRVYWNQKIREIIDSHEVLIYYQPIFDIKQKCVCHYEALLRIPDGDKILAPAALIHAAERSKNIFELDMLIMEQVIKDIARLTELGKNAKFSVNVSGISFQRPALVGRIRQLLSLHRVDPQKLICEITETAAIQDVALTTQVMQELKQFGVQIALDDFGVGFSSIYYLKHFPFNQVKIDGSFIRNLHFDHDNQTLVKAIVDVAKAFGLKTVAEFVENEEILNLLHDMQVDFAQGYHISHPLPLERIFKL
ncbi:MAG: EAL domain-containing protein [Oceanospirillaceae bacterium]|nr:EAL domain-containing protein [Oceanospirillaceae bacterium]MCP5335501.1 EAL domain-containing protein [Oceanospirillaceae bacterium]MCP5349972.1 EAL domain-containing protein [Oceanospirillaceae bacterium]